MNDAASAEVSANKRLGEWLAVFGAASVFIANAAAIISGIDRISAQLSEWLDDLALAFGRTVATLIVAPLAVIVYGVAAYLIYRNWIAQRERLWRLAFWIVVATGATIPVMTTVLALRSGDSSEQVAELDRNFAHDLLRQQYSSGPFAGGVRFSTSDSSDVAQPWTTAQTLVALEQSRQARASTAEIAGGIRYLLANQTAKGGWGYMVGLASDVAEVNAWSARALIMSLVPQAGAPTWTDPEKARIHGAALRALGELAQTQMTSGAWSPILECRSPRNARTYSTIMAISAFTEARRTKLFSPAEIASFDDVVKRAAAFVLGAYRDESARSGWWPNPLERSPTGDYPGLTAQTLLVLEEAGQAFPVLRGDPRLAAMIAAQLTRANVANQYRPALSGRSISENDQPHDMESYLDACNVGTAESSTFLWYPWTLALAATAAADKDLPIPVQRQAGKMLRSLTPRLGELQRFANQNEAVYPTAEALLAIAFLKPS